MEVIERIARERCVERMASAVCESNAPEVSDLAQEVYLILLGKDPDWVVKAYEAGWLGFWLLNCVKKKWRGEGRFRTTFVTWRQRAVPLNAEVLNLADDE